MAFSPIPGLTLPKTGTALVPVSTKVAAPKTARTVTTPTKTTVAPAPPPAAPNYATLMAQAATQASKLAAQQIAAQVKAITDQQTQLHATATAQAAEINKASLAAAQFLSGLGDMTKSDYTAAVQNLAGMTGGYTGALRDTAQQAADAAQAQLSSIPGNEQTAVNRGDDLANLVYGVSGQIPANALTVQGLGATELARAVPQQELSYGQQQAIGQLGAGNKAADALNSQIATIRATLPSTTNTYLSTFQKTAEDQITNARNARIDALNVRKTNASIAATKATAKQRAAAAAAKLVPVVDIGRSKLTGYLTDQFGHAITKRSNGIEYAQSTPGWHFDSTGKSVPDPKPVTLEQMAALSARFTSVNHYKSDWRGYPVGGKITPVGGWVVSPDGQTAVPPTKPGKAFVPKIDRIGSAAAKHLVYMGEDGRLHDVTQADGKTTIPYDPNKPLAFKVINSGGYWVAVNQSTGEAHSLTDDNKVPLIAGTPKAPPAVHYGAPKVGRDGYYYTLDPSTGTMKRTDVLAPEKATATHYSGRYAGADGYWHVYDTSTAADIRLPTRVPAKTAAAGSWRMIKEPDGTIKFYNPTTQVTRDTPFKEAVSGTGTTAALDKPLTRSEVIRYSAKINNGLRLAVNGSPPQRNAAGKIIRPGHKKLDRAEVIAELKLGHYFDSPPLARLTMSLVNKYYPQVQSKGPLGATAGAAPDVPGAG